MFRSLKYGLFFLPVLVLGGSLYLYGYEAGILKNHNHTSAIGDGGTLSNLTVGGFVMATASMTTPAFSSTGPVTASSFTATGAGYKFPDGTTQASAGTVGGLTAGSSPTITGAWTFGISTPTTNNGMNFSGLASDPAAPVNGQLWYNSTVNRLKYNGNGTTVEIDPSFYVVNLLVAPNSVVGAGTQFFQSASNCVEVSSGTGFACAATAEAGVTTAIGIATLQRFSCVYLSVGGDPNTFTFTIDKNEAAQTMTCNFTGPSAGNFASCTTNTNPVTFASGDRTSLKLATSGGTTAVADSLRCTFVYSMGTQ